MTAFSSLISQARLHTRTTGARSNLITDSDLIILGNEALEDCRTRMIEVESNLVYGNASITTVDGTLEYSLPEGIIAPFPAPVVVATVYGLVEDGVWIEGEDWFLKEVSEEDKVHFNVDENTSQPQYYYLTEDFKMGLLPVPDDAYTVNLMYWKPVAALTTSASTMPWKDIWNRYVAKYLEYSILKIFERDFRVALAELDVLAKEAMVNVYKYGIRKRISKSNFFSLEGV